MGAVQSFVTSTEGGVIVAATLVFVGAVEYSSYRTSKQLGLGFEEEKEKEKKGREDKEGGAGGDAFDVSKARKKKGKKHAVAAQTITQSAAEASTNLTTTALPIPGDFDAASKVTPKLKNKTKARLTAVASAPGTSAFVQTVEAGDDETSSATPNEARSGAPVSASGSKPKKSKKKKPAARASTSTLTLPDASSSKTTLSASNPAAIQPSAVLTSTLPTKDPAARVKGTGTLASRGSKSKDSLHSEEGSATDDDGKPFLASLSSSRQETIGHSRVLGIPPTGMSSVYPDTDSSWTHVQRGGRNNTSSSGAGRLSTSDTGVVSSITDDGYPSSPVAERAEDTEDDEDTQSQSQGLGLGSAYVRASDSSDDGSKNNNAPRKTLPDNLKTSDNLNPSRIVRLRPLPGEKPANGFSWADYEDVNVDEGAGHDADGEDDGWGVVRSRRSRLDRGSSTSAGTPAGGDAGAGTSQAQKEISTLTKKQRQNAKRREATKAAKAETEAERLATLTKHRQQLEKARMLEQISKSSSKVPSGGMKAAVDGNGKLIWDHDNTLG